MFLGQRTFLSNLEFAKEAWTISNVEDEEAWDMSVVWRINNAEFEKKKYEY